MSFYNKKSGRRGEIASIFVIVSLLLLMGGALVATSKPVRNLFSRAAPATLTSSNAKITINWEEPSKPTTTISSWDYILRGTLCVNPGTRAPQRGSSLTLKAVQGATGQSAPLRLISDITCGRGSLRFTLVINHDSCPVMVQVPEIQSGDLEVPNLNCGAQITQTAQPTQAAQPTQTTSISQEPLSQQEVQTTPPPAGGPTAPIPSPTPAPTAVPLINRILCPIPIIGGIMSCPPSQTMQPTKYSPRDAEMTIPASSPSSVKSTAGSEKKYGRDIIPTVLGTVSDYTGSATFDYSFLLPQGPAGFSPSLGLSYSSQTVDDARAGIDNWPDKDAYMPSIVGHGFSLNSGGYVVRDPRGDLGRPLTQDGTQSNHRFIVVLPGAGSFELKYNPANGKWSSIPQGFLNITHQVPEIDTHKASPKDVDYPFRLVYEHKSSAMGGNLKFPLDYVPWIIKTKDGTTYYFGDAALTDKLKSNSLGQFKDAQPNLANEFEVAQLCDNDTCIPRDTANPVFMTTKWLLKKIVTVDGKEVNFNYSANQKIFSENRYKTTSVYPLDVNWNNNIHRVLFELEDRSDKGRENDTMTKRIKTINIQTKLQNKDYQNVRSYKIEYYSTKESQSESPGIGVGENFVNKFANCDLPKLPIGDPCSISFIKSIQEVGEAKDSNQSNASTPKITFSYTAAVPEMQGAASSNLGGFPAVYLAKIDNGAGGETRFNFESFNVGYIDKNGNTDVTAAGRFGSTRARVTEKTVTDKIENNKSFKTKYQYTNPKGFSEQIATGTDSPPTGLQFLGHETVDVKVEDFNTNGSGLLSHSATLFNQANKTQDPQDPNKLTCFEPHLAKGMPKEQFVYLGESTVEPPKKTTTEYQYRTVTAINQDPNTCNSDRANQPYFVYTTKTYVTSKDGVINTPVEILDSQGQSPAKQILRTGSKNLEYDNYGNLTKSVSFGLVDENGNDVVQPNRPSDNRYSFTSFTTIPEKNIFTLPNLSYSATSENCLPGNSTYPNCARGKTEIFYDNQEYLDCPVKPDEKLPKFGRPTKQRAYLDAEKVAITKTIYDCWGNVTESWAPMANKEANSETDESGLMKISEASFDTYYHQLPQESKKWIKPDAQNKTAYYQKERIEYDDTTRLLQVPKKVLTQIQKDREVYNFVEMEYDALGRLLKTYAKDPNSEGNYLTKNRKNVPVSLSFYFDPTENSPYKGYSTRSMVLSSKDGKDGLTGNYTYTTTDTLYNGLGQVRQSQLLKTMTYIYNKDKKEYENIPVKLVSVAPKVNSAGATIDTYEPQTADPVEMNLDLSDANYYSKIYAILPSFVGGLAQTNMSHTDYDGLGRPRESRVTDTTSDTTMTTTNSYSVNAVKSTSPKGVEKISIADVWGRPVYEITTSADGAQKLLTKNDYAQALTDMIDKPTSVTVKPLLPASSTNLLSTSTFRYDTAGRLVASSDPSLGSFEYVYDILGNKLKETQVSGSGDTKKQLRQSSFGYDSLGRLSTSKIYTQHSGDPASYLYRGGLRPITAFYYDEAPYALGKITKVDDPSGSTTYTYDQAQRLASTAKTVFDKSKTFSTVFDELSRPVASMLDQDKIDYGYDFENRNQGIKLNRAPLQENIRVDKWGKTVKVGYPYIGGTMFNANTYDSLGRIKKIQTQSQTVNFDQDVNYNQAGEISSTKEKEPAKNLEYAYDGFSQLKSVQGQAGFLSSYSYDPFGRITSKSEDKRVNLQYQPAAGSTPLFAPSRITFQAPPQPAGFPGGFRRPPVNPAGSGMDLKYDFQGNLLNDDKNCYTYNLLGQLTYIRVKKITALASCEKLKPTDFTKIISFAYDFEGALVFEAENSATYQPQKQTFIFGSMEDEYSKDSKGALVLSNSRLSLPLQGYVSAVKNRTLDLKTINSPNKIYYDKIFYVVKDYLSSTRHVVDRATGNAVGEQTDYFPFGAFSKKKTLETNKLFTGQRIIDDLSIYHFGARFYSPSLGIFIQPDKVEEPNRYAYAKNNPAQFKDLGGFAAIADSTGGAIVESGGCQTCGFSLMGAYDFAAGTGVYPVEAKPFSSDRLAATLGYYNAATSLFDLGGFVLKIHNWRTRGEDIETRMMQTQLTELTEDVNAYVPRSHARLLVWAGAIDNVVVGGKVAVAASKTRSIGGLFRGLGESGLARRLAAAGELDLGTQVAERSVLREFLLDEAGTVPRPRKGISMKLPRDLSAAQVENVLEKYGFEFSRQRGTSHAVWVNRTTGRSVPVPRHGAIKTGTLNGIITLAGLTREQFILGLRKK